MLLFNIRIYTITTLFHHENLVFDWMVNHKLSEVLIDAANWIIFVDILQDIFIIRDPKLNLWGIAAYFFRKDICLEIRDLVP